MSRPEEMELIDRHLAGVLRPDEVERLEHLIRTSPKWAQAYREAEDLARLMRKGLGDGAPAPAAVKEAIRRRVERTPQLPRRPAWFTRRFALAAAAGVLLAVSAAVLWPRDDLLPTGHPDAPLAMKDLARRSVVAFEAETLMRDGQVRVSPGTTLFGQLGGRAIVVPAALTAGHRVAVFGEYTGDGMIQPVEGMRGIVHLDGVQRWEGKDRQPAETRALVAQAAAQRSLAETLADLEAFLASDDSRVGSRAGLAFTADVTARHLGSFDFEAIMRPLLKLVLSGDKHPEVRNAAAEGLERSNPEMACDVLLRTMADNPMPALQAESEDGQVVLGCLDLLRRRGDAALAPTLRRLAATFEAPAMKAAADAALAAVTGHGPRTGSRPAVVAPKRFSVDGHECIVMAGGRGRRHGLVVIGRGTQGVAAFRPVINAVIARGFAVLVVPAGVPARACVEACEALGAVPIGPRRRYLWHASAQTAQLDQGAAARLAVVGADGSPGPIRLSDRELDKLLLP